jgi:hypothetical protein
MERFADQGNAAALNNYAWLLLIGENGWETQWFSWESRSQQFSIL